MSKTIHDLDVAQLDALIARLKEAKEFSLTLKKEDIDLLLRAIATLVTLQASLASNSITINKMRKLMARRFVGRSLQSVRRRCGVE